MENTLALPFGSRFIRAPRWMTIERTLWMASILVLSIACVEFFSHAAYSFAAAPGDPGISLEITKTGNELIIHTAHVSTQGMMQVHVDPSFLGNQQITGTVPAAAAVANNKKGSTYVFYVDPTTNTGNTITFNLANAQVGS